MVIPQTYSELATFSACRAFSQYFQIDDALFERLFNALRSGNLQSVTASPSGETVLYGVDAADGSSAKKPGVISGKEPLRLTPLPALNKAITQSVSLRKAMCSVEYTPAYLATLRSNSSGSGSGGGSSNNNNNNNNKNNNH